MSYTVFGQCLVKRVPISDFRTKEIIDNGENHVLTLGSGFEKKDTADRYAKNLLANQKDGSWNVWVEEAK